MYKKVSIISLLIWTAWSCTPKVQPGANSGNNFEDLAIYRPTYPAIDTVDTGKITEDKLVNIIPKHHINSALNLALDNISILSQEVKYTHGYTVQIYSGNSREAANITSGKAYALLNTQDKNLQPKISYKAPNFKVQVGRFFSTVDTHSVYARLIKKFPHAIIVMKKFQIDRD